MLNPFEVLENRLASIEIALDKIANQPAPQKSDPEKLLTPNQFCDHLGISRVTLWTWDKEGITHPVRIGKLKRYKLSSIDTLKEGQT